MDDVARLQDVNWADSVIHVGGGLQCDSPWIVTKWLQLVDQKLLVLPNECYNNGSVTPIVCLRPISSKGRATAVKFQLGIHEHSQGDLCTD